MLVLCNFLSVYKSHKSTQKELKNLKMDAVRWVKAGSTRYSKLQSRYNEIHSRYNEEPQDQLEAIFAAVKLRGLDPLEHETLEI